VVKCEAKKEVGFLEGLGLLIQAGGYILGLLLLLGLAAAWVSFFLSTVF